MEDKEKKNYYDAAMRQINGDSLCLSAYEYLKNNAEFSKGKEITAAVV